MEERTKNKGYQILPECAKDAEGLDIILTCDGASSVGQVGHEVAVKLTKENPNSARMCCITAVGAGSKLHVEIAQKARRLIVINGCQLECASKVVRSRGIEPDYEITVAKQGVKKLPSLDFSREDVLQISERIVKDLKNKKQ